MQMPSNQLTTPTRDSCVHDALLVSVCATLLRPKHELIAYTIECNSHVTVRVLAAQPIRTRLPSILASEASTPLSASKQLSLTSLPSPRLIEVGFIPFLFSLTFPLPPSRPSCGNLANCYTLVTYLLPPLPSVRSRSP